MYRVILILACIFFVPNNVFAVKADSWYEEEAQKEQQYRQQQQQEQQQQKNYINYLLYSEPIIKVLSEIQLGMDYWTVQDIHSKYKSNLGVGALLYQFDDNAKLSCIKISLDKLNSALSENRALKDPNYRRNMYSKEQPLNISKENFIETIEKFTGAPKGSFKIVYHQDSSAEVNNYFIMCHSYIAMHEGEKIFIAFSFGTTKDNQVGRISDFVIAKKLPTVGPKIKGFQLGGIEPESKEFYQTVALDKDYNSFQIDTLQFDTEKVFKVELRNQNDSNAFIKKFIQHYQIKGTQIQPSVLKEAAQHNAHISINNIENALDCGDYIISFEQNARKILLYHKGYRKMLKTPQRSNEPNFN